MQINIKGKQWKVEGKRQTPYQRGKAEWDERIGSVVVQSKNWRYATFGCLLLLGITIAGLIYVGTRPKLEPYIVQLNTQTGNTTYRGKIAKQWSDFTPPRASTKIMAMSQVDAPVTMLRVYGSCPGVSAMMNLRFSVEK